MFGEKAGRKEYSRVEYDLCQKCKNEKFFPSKKYWAWEHGAGN